MIVALALTGLSACGGGAGIPSAASSTTSTKPGSTPSSQGGGTLVATVADLRASAAFPPLLPTWTPPTLHVGPIQAWRYGREGKITELTVTYAEETGDPAIQLYEALSSYPNRGYGGATVSIRPGVTGRYDSSLPVLQWTENNTYCAIQAGGPIPTGVPLTGGVSEADLVRMAASVIPPRPGG